MGLLIGYPNNRGYMEKRFAKPKAVTLQVLIAAAMDITLNTWAHFVGVFALPKNLKKLSLYYTYLSPEDMAIIGTLPNLEILKLIGYAFSGKEWNTRENEFCRLKYLQIEKSGLKDWSSAHFPILECLILSWCEDLKEFPASFADNICLRLIMLTGYRISLLISATQIQEERLSYGDDKVFVEWKWKKKKKNKTAHNMNHIDSDFCKPFWRILRRRTSTAPHGDVAAEAESKIELELYQLYNEEDAPVEPYQSLHQTLQQVTRDIESLDRRIIQIQIESNRNHSVEPPRRNAAIENIKADSSSKRSSEPNNVMVGCDDEFETIKHKLISDSKNLEVISITGMGGIGKTTLAQRVYKDEATIASYFDIRAWTTVSQEHNLRQMLCDLLGSNDTDLDVSHLEKDEEIKVKELIRLWIAEGFLKLELNKSMEDVAYDYLHDLVDRGLVQIDKWSCFDNKIKYCKLHDVLHNFSLREAQREKLLFVIKGNNNVHELGLATSSSDRKACCRVVSDQLRNEPINPSRLNDLPREIEDLVHLRYLALRIRLKTQYTIAFINHQWFKLRCLQTIIIDGCWPCFSPNNILGMPQIRHVHFSKRTLHHLHLPKLVQENLQTLSWLSLPHRLRTEPDFKGIPNVKELGIQLMDYKDCYDMHSLSKETWDLLPPISMEGLLNLNQLENLKFETNQWSQICDLKLQKVFPPNLKKLTFKRTYFSWEDMAIIHTLPNLEILKLRYNAFCGPEWKATGNGFCKLKYLEVTGHSTLEHWSVVADHFPILECIFLNGCDHLVEFPTGFGEINTLQLIHLKHCSSSLVTSAKNIQEDRRDFGDDKLVLHVFYTLPEPKVEIERGRSEGDKTGTVYMSVMYL
nr:putative late blight resistance protein homolog R1B-14 isoform X1 [Ipomoea batatas]